MAAGSPAPRIAWLLSDGSAALPVAGLRHTHPNGSLELPAFPAERYNPDVHAATYRCKASNQVGSVISRDVHVRGVVKQDYNVQVYDEHVVSGNTAALKCHVPPYVAEYIMVTSWEVDGVNLYPNSDLGGKHLVLANGDLYIQDASPPDGYREYTCRTLHRLTGQTQASPFPGRVIITEPKGSVQLRVTVEKHQQILAKIGEDVVLPCLAQGQPVPTYKWHREERPGQLYPLQLDERVGMLAAGLLRIKKTRLSDAGKFVCVVTNSAGEETVQVVLTVTAPLSAHISPPSQEVSTGSEAVLECSVGGQPVTRVQWLKDSSPLLPGPRVSVSTRPGPERVTVAPVSKEDRGMYQCVTTNDRDMAQGTAELKLGDAIPELVYSFSEQTLQPGPAVSLKCVAVGIPPPQFSWTLDGFPLPENQRFLVGQYVTIHDDVISHVNISYVKEEDGGEYTCTARNSVGSKSHSARINVYGKPFIREMPKITAVAGKDLVIKCPVAGYPIETITWEHDGVVLPLTRRQRVFANGTLVVQQTQQKGDQGTYTCQATNRQKHTARRDVEVAVQIPPRIMPINPLSLREDQRAAISCQILEGDHPLSFRWERNGRPLPQDAGVYTRRHDEFSSMLVIERVSAAHTANYTCVASNVAGPVKFTVSLTVNVPPRWLVEPVDTSVSAGQDVSLHCQAEGSPPPVVSWKKAVGSMPGDYKDFMFEQHVALLDNGTLHFARASKESEGHYMCEAGNTVGADVSKVVFLKVNAPAHFTNKWKQVQVAKGESAHLQCTALGDLPIEIVWRFAGQRLSAESDHRFTVREQALDGGLVSELGISRTSRHDTTTFSCSASNLYGRDDMTIQLVVQEVPEMPQNVRVSEQHSRSVQLSWPPPYSGNSPISNYILQYKLVSDQWPTTPLRLSVPGTQTSATLSGLSPASSYHVRILAENRLGLSEPSEAIQVTTQEEVPSGAPQAVRAEARSSTELVVTWEPPARDSWHGTLQGYYVGYMQVTPGLTGPTTPAAAQSYMLKTVEVGSQYGGEASLIGLNKFTTYNVIVQAFNSRGAGPMSEPVSVRTMEDAPSMPPENLNCRPTSVQELQIQWQAPPAEGRNGNLQGFKVLYQPAEDWFEEDGPELKVTSSTSTTLQSLLSYTNYSVYVLAFTGSGDGVRSTPVFCRTDEDVPSAPADIKALVASPNSVVVSWLPPTSINGVLLSYTFYWAAVREDGKEGAAHSKQLPPDVEQHEVTRVSSSAAHKFWVTASTRVGESEPSQVASVRPSSRVPARIISFSRSLVTPWKRNLTLACRSVGIPAPKVSWRVQGKPLEPGGRLQVGGDHALLIRDVQHLDEGNYTCAVENSHGNDDILYSLVVRVPPGPPTLTVVSSDSDSLHLHWSDSNNGVHVLGYVISYKRDHGDWEELHLPGGHLDSYVLQNLLCGNRYQLYITAYNRIGTGLPCDIVHTATKGTVPVTPSQAALLTVNSTVVTLWLDAWADGGCPIQYLIVEYREDDGEPAEENKWLLVCNNVQVSERARSVPDLTPGSRYQLRVTAHNSAGSVQAVYNFTTLSLAGVAAPLPPDPFPTASSTFTNARVVLPIVLSCATFVVLCLLGLVLRQRKLRERALSRSGAAVIAGETASVAQLQNQHNRDQHYLAVRSGPRQTSTLETNTYKTVESSDYIKDICPYATFQLNPPGNKTYSDGGSTCSYSGNIYSGPYHSVRGSFVYHDPKMTEAETYKLRHQKEPEYTKVRRKSGKLRDPHSESQESDNLGSTDSEVKKILTLHLPISEYDTLGSDSEGEGSGQQHEMASFRQRMPRGARTPLAPSKSAAETSSSSETSPVDNRKQFQSRKSKSKGQLAGKRHVRSSSGYSSHTEETTFSLSNSFSDRIPIQPPSRFSDSRSHSRDLDETDNDPKRRSSRSSRISREASFQINV